MALNSTTFDSAPSQLSKFQLPSLPPLTISLTAGTDIPSPPPSPSPPRSLAPDLQRQPPAERATNPLSSHPTTPSELMPGAFPLSPSPLQDRDRPPIFPGLQPATTTTSTSSSPSASLAPATPISPSSTTSTSTKRPSSVRRFLSLRSLNISYLNNNKDSKNKTTPFISPSSSPLSQQQQQQQARPASPLSTTLSSSSRPGLRKKKSASWFRRQSSMGFDELVSANGNEVGDKSGVEEVENRKPFTNGSGEEMAGVVALERPRSPPPRLPELGGLGLSLDVGGLGEGMFGGIR